MLGSSRKYFQNFQKIAAPPRRYRFFTHRAALPWAGLFVALSWALALAVDSLPAGTASAPGAIRQGQLLVAALVLALLAALLACRASRRMRMSIEETEKAMREAAESAAPPLPLPVDTWCETGGIIHSFNLLAARCRRGDATLADVQRRLCTLVDNSPEAIFVQTRGCFAYVNAATLGLLGAQARRELLGQAVIDRVHPDHRALVAERCRQINDGAEIPHAMEVSLLRLDGAIIHAEILAIPYTYQLENSALAFVRDITGRKRAEEALRKSEARFHQLVSLSSEWYWEIDENYQLVQVEGWQAMADNPSPAPLPENAFGQWLVRTSEAIWKRHHATLEARQAFTDFEFAVEKPNGSIAWYRINGQPLFSEGGVFTGYHGTGKEITSHKLAVEALRESQARIREMVAHQDRIKEEERKRIARDIHDDLGQTLLAMRIDASMLVERLLGVHPKLRNSAGIMLGQIDAAMRSVKSVINNLRPPALDLGLFAALRWQVRQFQEKNPIACELTIDDPEFDRDLDERRSDALFRIVQEALTNIAKHARASHVSIEIRTRGNWLDMRIADNGIGISAENRKKKNSFGLVGAEERIGALGGTLEIAGDAGKGTLLVITVPVEAQTGPR